MNFEVYSDWRFEFLCNLHFLQAFTELLLKAFLNEIVFNNKLLERKYAIKIIKLKMVYS